MNKLREKIERSLEEYSAASFIAGVLCAVLIAAAALLLYFELPVSRSPSRPDSLAAMKKISEAEWLIRHKYLEEMDESVQTDDMIRGLVAGLDDKYAAYYTKEEYEEIKKEHAGMIKGIGVQLAQDAETGELLIVYVMEDSPAEKAGVLEKDRILEINGQDMTGKSSLDASDLIRAAEGPITLKLYREGEEDPIELTMEKEDIKGNVVFGTMLEGDIGYIAITSFNGLTSEQFAENYDKLQEEGMQALVIDLRDNLGGLVSACCDTASQILPEGPIVFEQDRLGKERHQDCAGETPIDIPLVLLVNRYTASASEIFTGAVRDYGLATIVGTRTYGKGVEQNTYVLSDGSALKLTTTVYYTPNHEDLNGVGIVPDEMVVLTEGSETDVQLDKAMEILQEQLEERAA